MPEGNMPSGPDADADAFSKAIERPDTQPQHESHPAIGGSGDRNPPDGVPDALPRGSGDSQPRRRPPDQGNLSRS